MIELQPSGGTRVRRPATVVIVVASDWPLDLLPDLPKFDLASARGDRGRRAELRRTAELPRVFQTDACDDRWYAPAPGDMVSPEFMGTMFDTVADPARSFRGLRFDAIAAYGNGSFANYDLARRQFPRLRLLEIDVSGAGIGNAGDFEPGDMSYAHAGRWANGRITAGVWRPALYFSVSHWQEIMSSLIDAGVARSDVRIWTAHYTGKEHLCSSACGFGVIGTADATQWGSSDHPETLPSIYAHRDIDVSKTADDFWGAAPVPPPFKRALKVGSTGHAVEIWQRQMKRRGWHIAVNGTYDASSATICKAFQSEKGFTVTGNVNRATWNATWTAPITA